MHHLLPLFPVGCIYLYIYLIHICASHHSLVTPLCVLSTISFLFFSLSIDRERERDKARDDDVTTVCNLH